jgi:signal-transduction protein with cAMP-binding, CBS, and nucleotidyltransferase domain
MIVTDLMRYDAPCALPKSTPNEVLELMRDYKISQIAYLCDNEYKALLNDAELEEMDADKPLEMQTINFFFKPFTSIEKHVFEILSVFGKYNISLLPVMSDKQQYAGIILAEDVMKSFDSMRPSMLEGAILIIETAVHDYSASQIANIVEANDAKILHLFVAESSRKEFLEVIICINQTSVNRILQTFYRYHYNIKAVFSSLDANDDLQENYNLLMKYLTI